jgi:SAM-dependent methyltransferase
VDAIPGVETHRAVYLSALGLQGESGDDAQPYEPISDEDFEAVIGSLAIEPSRFTFIDLGSGKGRALLLAARLGFARIVGIEYSRDLHLVAQRNLDAARAHWPNVDRIELRCEDAADFDPPPEPVICFLFNPFGGSVMRRVISRWVGALSRHDKDLWIVYANPTQRPILDGSQALAWRFNAMGCAVFRRRFD